MAERVIVDVEQGTADGIGLGSSRRAIERRLGRAAGYSENSGVLPVHVMSLWEVGFPYVTAPPRRGPAFGDLVGGVMRYPMLTVQTTEASGAYAVLDARPGLRTKEGVQVGDSLASARAEYPFLRCGTRNEGSEHPAYPYCAGRVRPGVYVWFGQDPIRSISFASRPMG